ncbi:hypothetical protein [Stenotrophomonas phage BUCTxx99]|nr:hypothetical protein [Stenotrophomonas phage BUCTxx99]
MSTKEIELPRGDTFDSQMRRYTFSEGQVRDILAIYTQAQQDEIDRLRSEVDDLKMSIAFAELVDESP